MFYQIEPIRSGLWRIWDASRTAFYLAEGENAAALIDSGVGVGSVREVVRGLTGKPVSVWLTHGHVDHAMGAGEFDEIHMNAADIPVFNIHSSMQIRQGYVSGSVMSGADSAVITSINESDYIPAPITDRLQSLTDGQRADLGGIHLRFIQAEGHTPGCMTVLFEEWRMMILGDACNAFTFLFDPWCPAVEDYRKMLLRLKAQTDGSYDRLLFNHGTGEGTAAMIENVISVCDDVLDGRSDAMPFRGPSGENVLIAKAMDFRAFRRADGGEGNLVYRPDP